MAGRKELNTVTYFPHKCIQGKTMFILEGKFGNDGYSTWFKTLEQLGLSEYHFIDCRDESTWQYLQAKMKLDADRLKAIYDTLAKLGSIHQELWDQKIIWSFNFIDGLKELYNRRRQKCMHFNDLCIHLSIKCKHKYNDDGISTDKNTHNRTEYNRTEQRIDTKVSLVEIRMSEFPEIDALKKKYAGLSREVRGAMLLAKYMFDILITKYPDHTTLKNAKVKVWMGDADLLLRVDKIEPAKAKATFDFAMADSFWNSVVRSPANLRKNFDTIRAKMTSVPKGKEENPSVIKSNPKELTVENLRKQQEEALKS
jgi:hypothetical protein